MTDEIDADKIDDAVLALLYLGVHGDSFLPETMARAWKGFDWEAMNRLHEKGFIWDPVNKAKSVVLTEQGLARSKALFDKMFAKSEPFPA